MFGDMGTLHHMIILSLNSSICLFACYGDTSPALAILAMAGLRKRLFLQSLPHMIFLAVHFFSSTFSNLFSTVSQLFLNFVKKIQLFLHPKGSPQIDFLEKFGILSQPGPPPSPKIGTPKTKKN